MGNDTSVMAYAKKKMWNSESEEKQESDIGSEKKGERAERSAAASTSTTKKAVVKHNKEDVETHHGLVLQRFDSADWMMMKTKMGKEKQSRVVSGGSESSPPSRLSKESDYAKGHTPKLKPSAREESAGSPCRTSPLGK